MAGNIGGNPGGNSVGLRGEFLTRHLERGFDLFAECLLEPAFSEERGGAEALHPAPADQDPRRSSLGRRVPASSTTRSTGSHPYHPRHGGRGGLGRSLDRAAAREGVEGQRLAGGGMVVMSPRWASATLDAGPGVGREEAGQVAPRHGQLSGERRSRASPRRSSVQQDAKKAQAHLVYGFLGRDAEGSRSLCTGGDEQRAERPGPRRLFIELRDKRSMAYSVSSFAIEGSTPATLPCTSAPAPEKVPAAVAGDS